MRKSDIEKKVNNTIIRLKKKYLLQDWSIFFTVDMSKTGKLCGHVEMQHRAGLKEAAILIFPNNIKTINEKGFSGETLAAVLEHEIIHLVIFECALGLDDKIHRSKAFDKFEELLVEKIRLIMHERKTPRRTSK